MSTESVKNWQSTWQEEQGDQQHQQDPKRQIKVKVHKKRWVTTGEKVIYTLLSGITITVLFFTVSFSSSTDSLNRDVQALENNIDKQQNLNQNLEYKVKELSNPDRIVQIAKDGGLKIQNAEVKQATALQN